MISVGVVGLGEGDRGVGESPEVAVGVWSFETLRMLRGAVSKKGWGDAARGGDLGPMGLTGSDCIERGGEDDGRGRGVGKGEV